MMSHATGLVKFNDGLIMWYEYDGTSDICLSRLYHTKEELSANWRTVDGQRFCSCGKDEPVGIYADYGVGSYWSGRACRFCHAITDGIMPFDENLNDLPGYADGVPAWVKKEREKG